MSAIAFLGTGLLGSGFVEAAAARGDTVTVWNRTTEKARALEAFGVRVADTPADAVRGVERVHLVLKDDTVVEEVIAALRPGLSPHAIIIDHTTTQPKLTAERATRLNAEGVRYLHCPVFIGPAAARLGQGSILACGPAALFEEVRPALEQMAVKVKYFGERPDLAAAYKLFGNAFIIGVTGLVADVFAIAAGSGVTPLESLDVLDVLNPFTTISGRGRKMAEGNFAPSFELTMARKDVRLMMETAGEIPTGALAGMAARMDALIAEGYGDEDLAVMGVAAVKH
ncbi:MAG: NAD(P)-dependent oxidoreductase [Gemmatimonadaceae bacterium]|nr:NAD(P)-dependent oxidoreductase [Gemmatimonadaceae bacterium]